MAASIAYIQYRIRSTLGVFENSKHPFWFALQALFLVCEILLFSLLPFHLIEIWNHAKRNCIDFKRIPNNMIEPRFQHPPEKCVPAQYSNYPTVAVLIPCYKEDCDLVSSVVEAACRIDYPTSLFDVYLCDDGQDPLKEDRVAAMRKTQSNVHYVVRPEHSHAKPGNVNYTLERTRHDLVVLLDADFIARPHILQRLLPYYFVWNEESGLYEFNNLVSSVQTPQHYRNLSPYDRDVFDQRNLTFFDVILPGKDWINCAPMIGTTNLINRTALDECGNFPFHSVGDDTAMSVSFHGKGFRTYYVNESLASGLATMTLRAHFSQRARWYKSDWQILFSRHGPFTEKGLSFFQRMVYLHMSYARVMSLVQLFFDFVVVVVLTTGFSVVDVTDPKLFVTYFVVYMGLAMTYRFILSLGKPGVFKSLAANEAFEIVFKYTTMKGLFIALFKGDKIEWKFTDKTVVAGRNNKKVQAIQDGKVGLVEDNVGSGRMSTDEDEAVFLAAEAKKKQEDRSVVDVDEDGVRDSMQSSNNGSYTSDAVEPTSDTGTPATDEHGSDGELSGMVDGSVVHLADDESDQDGIRNAAASAVAVDVDMEVRADEHSRSNDLALDMREGASSIPTLNNGGTEAEDSGTTTSPEEKEDVDEDDDATYDAEGEARRDHRSARRKEIWRNLTRCWYNALMIVVLLFAIIWAVVRTPEYRGNDEGGNITLPLALAFGFAIANLLPHILLMYVCVVPYMTGWVMSDLVHGRCDQWAVNPKTGKLFVPHSITALLSVARFSVIVGALVYVVVFSVGEF